MKDPGLLDSVEKEIVHETVEQEQETSESLFHSVPNSSSDLLNSDESVKNHVEGEGESKGNENPGESKYEDNVDGESRENQIDGESGDGVVSNQDQDQEKEEEGESKVDQDQGEVEVGDDGHTIIANDFDYVEYTYVGEPEVVYQHHSAMGFINVPRPRFIYPFYHQPYLVYIVTMIILSAY